MIDTVAKFKKRIGHYTEEERQRILQAAEWAEELHRGQRRASGEPYVIHPLKVAEILVDLEMDAETIVAALLHDILEDTTISAGEIRDRFGKNVEALVDGVTKISIIKAKSKSVQAAETIRKMLFAMTKDIRVILIKLADKLHNMSTLEFLPAEKVRAIATECLDIYAPLAGRLGISWLKAELEDLSLKALHPDVYQQIKSTVAQKKATRAEYLSKVIGAIYKLAKQEGYEIEVTTRAKHFYSIYRKMKRRRKNIDEIFDLLGIRILCKSENDCYALLGLVHKLWPPIEGRFKDYIAMPKANKYQSLHTTVMCYGGNLIEIQIRTHEMHRTAEYGIAAHWAYKEGFSEGKRPPEPRDLAIITKLKSWDGMKITSSEFLDEIKRELLKDSIYVFTPKGDVVELPKGSTPIDFAYHIHTEVGHQCFAAKADGSIIPLTQELKNTQVIEIITSVKATPHLNWLRFVRTASARSKIRHWLNQHDDSIILDKSIVVKKRPAGGHPVPGKAAAAQAGQHTAEAAPHSGALHGGPTPSPRSVPRPATPTGEIITKIIDRNKVAFKIGNEKNLMVRIANCCNPASGDDIVGYVSRGRGIIVHKRRCPNIEHIPDIKDRMIEVEWEAVSPRATRRFRVTARMTSDLFSEIEGAVRKYKGHLIEGKLEEDDRGNLSGAFTMELETKDDFKKVMKSIRTIPSVVNIQTTGAQDPASA